MAENLAADGGLVMAENLALQISHRTGRSTARDVVRRCSEEAMERRVAFADVVRGDPEVRRHLSDDEIAAALDPTGYLGSIEELIKRAQDAHRGARASS
jgi:3-carboxy-cis,cis-muconate cycloisomerase